MDETEGVSPESSAVPAETGADAGADPGPSAPAAGTDEELSGIAGEAHPATATEPPASEPPATQPADDPPVPEEEAAVAGPPPPTEEAPSAEPEDTGPPTSPEPGDALSQAEAAEKARVAEERESAAKEDARRLGDEIESLRARHVKDGRWQFRAFFEHERALHALFKELRPLHAADRNRLWSTFKQIGSEARRAQQEEWESRRYQSIEARETIEENIRRAEALAQGEGAALDLRRADSLLNEVRGVLGSNAQDSPGQVLIGPDRRACWDHWRQARDAVRLRRGGLQEHDYQALAARVGETVESAGSGDPFQAMQRVKDLQARLGKAYLRRGQFEELRRRLSEAWQAAQARIAEQRKERSKKRNEWRERMEGHVARWRETLNQKQAQREHLQQQMVKLEGMEKNARSEDFAVQVRGWKDESAEKLKRVEEFIADLEERIRSTSRKLGAPPPAEAASATPARPGVAGPPPEAAPAGSVTDGETAPPPEASPAEPAGEGGVELPPDEAAESP
jgi:hypothetical protein